MAAILSGCENELTEGEAHDRHLSAHAGQGLDLQDHAKLIEHRLAFLFTDRHAIYSTVRFFSELSDRGRIDWDLIRARDFKRGPDDPGKIERYQAETLVYQHVSLHALLGIVCYNEDVEAGINAKLATRSEELEVKSCPRWFF